MINKKLIYNYLQNNKKLFFWIMLLIFGIMLMIIPSMIKTNDSTLSVNKNVYDNEVFEHQVVYNETENKLIEILKKVDGVGEVDIMINYNTSESKSTGDDERKKSIYDKISDTNSNSLNQTSSVEGVIVVAKGADNVEIVNIIKTSVANILGVPIHKISVLKMKQ